MEQGRQQVVWARAKSTRGRTMVSGSRQELITLVVDSGVSRLCRSESRKPASFGYCHDEPGHYSEGANCLFWRRRLRGRAGRSEPGVGRPLKSTVSRKYGCRRTSSPADAPRVWRTAEARRSSAGLGGTCARRVLSESIRATSRTPVGTLLMSEGHMVASSRLEQRVQPDASTAVPVRSGRAPKGVRGIPPSER